MKKFLMYQLVILFVFCASASFAAQHETKENTTEKMNGMSETQKSDEDITMQEGDDYAQFLKSVSEMNGMEVIDTSGKTLGKITDAVLDLQTGKITYIMLKSGGLFGVGGQEYPIPWQALQTAPDHQGFQINMSSQDLENAPTGEQVTNKDQAREIHQFYGVSPNWEEGKTMKHKEDMESKKEYMEKEKEGVEMKKQDKDKETTY